MTSDEATRLRDLELKNQKAGNRIPTLSRIVELRFSGGQSMEYIVGMPALGA